jgi:hypothetical protein
MARITRDRENLLLEATALSPRVALEMKIQGAHCEVFAGFRGESLSIYFGAAPVYHFNAAGELRRAFVGDCLIKAESGQLVRSVRELSAEQVVLASSHLPAKESQHLVAEMTNRLNELLANLDSGALTVVGQVPEDGNATSRLQAWLATWKGPRIADIPNVS